MSGGADRKNGMRFPRLPPWLKFTIGGAVAAAALFFLISRLVQDWHSVPLDQLRFRPLPLAGSFALLILLHYPLYAHAWRLLLSGLDARIPFWRALSILSVTQLGKYIPGKVWFTLGRVSLAGREGIPTAKCLVSVLMETGFALLSAILLFGVAILFVPRNTLPGGVYLLFIAVPLCLLVVYPPVLNRILRLILRRLGQPVFRLNLSYPRLLGILFLYVIDWMIQGLGAFLIINSYSTLPLSVLPALIAGYSVSWILGFLFLLAPAGLGIREGVYTFMLDRMVQLGARASVGPGGLPLAIVSALVTRLWVTLSETGMAVAFIPFSYKRNRPEPTSKPAEPLSGQKPRQ